MGGALIELSIKPSQEVASEETRRATLLAGRVESLRRSEVLREAPSGPEPQRGGTWEFRGRSELIKAPLLLGGQKRPEQTASLKRVGN